VDVLREEMNKLAEKLDRFTNGGITVTAITPI
jgi:hypothetical protein